MQVREELERFLEDDDDMMKMCLTRRKEVRPGALLYAAVAHQDACQCTRYWHSCPADHGQLTGSVRMCCQPSEFAPAASAATLLFMERHTIDYFPAGDGAAGAAGQHSTRGNAAHPSSTL